MGYKTRPFYFTGSKTCFNPDRCVCYLCKAARREKEAAKKGLANEQAGARKDRLD